ncbi:MAG: AAA family ATPase [Xanthobacteraceae bacterium]|nr:AAA family ATPase [Xanthobacteraceae bacterium]
MARDVDQWLSRIGLAQYAALFTEQAVDLEVLPELTEQDLKDLDIPLGHRKRLMKAIAAFGGGVAAPAAAAPRQCAPAARPDAERRQLTVMFCDLVGSTALSTQLDPEDMRDVIRAYQDACTKVIARYGGYVAKYLGDAVLVYFGYPQAHGNDAERATRAALGIVEAVRGIGWVNETLCNVSLAVRVGINTGLVVVGDIIGEGAAEQASVVGETPNVAARLQELAGPDEVVIGPLTRELIGEGFCCECMDSNVLHGVAEPVTAWRVVGEGESRVSAETSIAANALPLVGRAEELGLLLRSWDASKGGQGQAVLIQGEAGIGKTRLVEAMRGRLSSVDYVWAAVRCSPYHANTTLYPVIEHLKRVSGWRAEDDDARKLAKLEAVLAMQSLPLERAVPLFADLMALALPEGSWPPLQLTAQEQREQTLDALVSWLLETAERKPVLQVWEDLHWADPTTLELLGLFIDQSPTVAMTNVLTYCADFTPPWSMRSHMILITLNRLAPPEVEALILQRTGGKSVPAEVVEYVVRKTDGVPLYVEELTKAILEADFLRDAGDRYELARPLSGVTIPATLQELLMARLDRLPSIREVAQLGSILGREFAYEMLQAIASLEQTVLEQGLDQLVGAELLYQRGRRPRARYVFKHALVQDAAYQSLLKRTRQFYHGQVAHLLETRYPEVAQTQPELIAQHYSKAEDDENAARYFAAMAEKAAAMSAHAEAIAALEEARRHCARMSAETRDRSLVSLSVRQACSLHFLGRRREIVELLEQQRDSMQRLSDRSLSAEYFFWLGFAHAWLGHREEALAHLERSLAEAKAASDRAIAGRVHRALATEYVYSGKPLAEAVAHGHQAVALLEQTEDRFWLSQALFTLSYCCIFAGDFTAALQAASRLNEFGDAAGIRRAQANAAMLSGLACAMRGEGSDAVALCQHALDVSPDDFETAFILACLGRACLVTGDVPRAVDSLERAVALADEVRSVQFCAWFRTLLGEAYLAAGELSKGAVTADEALATSTKMRFAIGAGLSRQLLGRIAQAQGDGRRARHELDAAVELLASVGATFELSRTQRALAEVDGDGSGGGSHRAVLDPSAPQNSANR